MEAEAGCRARLVFRPEYEAYDFGPEHPLRPDRMRSSLDLIASAGLGPAAEERLAPPSATEQELTLIHGVDYREAVRRLSLFADDPLILHEAARWGLGRGDCPAFPGMHEASAAIAGGTLHAVRGVLEGAFDHAFNPAGGLHHAGPDRASGFCIYNDISVAIAHAVQRTEARVLYLDFDVHHGDGVQAAFYDDPRVLTFSIHETGRHLFPGTGSVHELGEGLGRGYSLNLPVQPFTEDGSWLESLERLLPLIAERFAPDVIVSQHGCDSHAWDPLAHLRLSTRAYFAQARLVHDLAHRLAGGRWVALGGGGYDWVRVVPRSWSIIWAEMSGRRLPQQVPADWAARWAGEARRNDFWPLPERFLDDPDTWEPIPRRAEVERENRELVDTVRDLAAPALLRQAFPASRPDAPGARLPRLARQLGGAVPESRAAAFHTSRGPIELRDLCPGSLLERLRPDPGLAAFTRRPEVEYELLKRIAADPRSALSVAHTPDGLLVAQATLAEGEYWWAELDGTYELSLEVSRDWRQLGLGEALLRFTVEAPWVEHLVLVAIGLIWHWDLDGTGLGEWSYRGLLSRMFGRCGFQELRTGEPNVRMNDANVLLARIGSAVSPERRAAFEEAVQVRPAQRQAGSR